MSRVAPLAPPWSEDDAAGITSWGHPDRTYEPLLLVRILQRHPALAAKLRTLGEALYVDTKLPPRVRTIAILRICALLGCAYEWGGQAAFWGPIAKVSDAECDALVTGAEAVWSDE
ncbi:carboxymuconolactone decarboxylase family protein, partial [Mycobacterium sp. ITM-2017-0098]